MAKFVKGDVVVLPFPFSDLSQAKRRPAFVLTTLNGDDLILCQITSRSVKDINSVPLLEDDFAEGGLHQQSNIRPNRLFTADSHIVLYRIGCLKPAKTTSIVDKVIEIISR